MSIILVADVFGKTPALIQLSKELNAKCLINPYNGQNMEFKNESKAYAYFMEQIGLDCYLDKLLTAIKSLSSASTLIGFSIGASTVWRLSEKISVDTVKSGICFYGSQIRNYAKIVPQFTIELVFPKREEHFDISALQTMLSETANVKTRKVDYLHGFMNYYSKNYNQQAYKEEIGLLSAFSVDR